MRKSANLQLVAATKQESSATRQCMRKKAPATRALIANPPGRAEIRPAGGDRAVQPTHAHHLQVAALKSSLSAVDSGSSRTMRLRRSLSTVVRSNPSSPRQKPFQTHSSLASANGRPRNLASSSSFWANPPRAQQRPALSRATTWRTSAPRLATEDEKEDLNV